MTENVENLMLEHLKKFQATLDSMQRDIRELKVRQSETHAAVLGLRRDQLSDACRRRWIGSGTDWTVSSVGST